MVLEGLLAKEPEKRLTAEQALRFPLFKNYYLSDVVNKVDYSNITDLLTFKQARKEKKANLICMGVLQFIGLRVITEKRYNEIKEVFRYIETVTSKFHDGFLRQTEVNSFYSHKERRQNLMKNLECLFKKFGRTATHSSAESSDEEHKEYRGDKKTDLILGLNDFIAGVIFLTTGISQLVLY